MSNYPPGVSGNEDAFGPQSEDVLDDQEVVCPLCETAVKTQIVRITWNYTVEDWMECPECGKESTTEVEVEQDYPENLFEEMLDMERYDY
jgi:endogenous inhibitor of DNA gyrase (YacG/DUF329 family)